MKFVFTTDWHLSSVSPGSRIDDFVEVSFRKVEYVLQRCKELEAVLLLGGDMFMTPTQTDSIKNRLKGLILKYGVRVISIAGNHDLLYYSMDYLDKTSFKSLISPGVIEHLEEYVDNTVTIEGINIVAHPFGKPFPEVKEGSIVLSHTFYGVGKGDRLHTSVQEVFTSKAAFACFGHDHNMYAIENSNGTIVVRPGALTRGTSHTENRVRQVSFAVLDTAEHSVVYEPIPFAMKFEEVFKEKYDVTVEHTPVTFDEIQKFIEELRNAKMEVSPFDILHNMGKPDKVIERATGYLNAVGLIQTS